MERYAFYAGPLLMIALIVWLAGGRARPPLPVAVVACAAPIAVAAEIPFARLIEPGTTITTFGLVPMWRVVRAGTLGVEGVVAMALLAGAALCATAQFTPRPIARVAVPPALAGLMIAGSLAVMANLRETSSFNRRAAFAGPEPDWVDRRVGQGADALFLFTTPSPLIAMLGPRTRQLLSAEFWNRSIRRTRSVDTGQVCAVATEGATLDPVTGRLTDADAAIPASGSRDPELVVSFRDTIPAAGSSTSVRRSRSRGRRRRCASPAGRSAASTTAGAVRSAVSMSTRPTDPARPTTVRVGLLCPGAPGSLPTATADISIRRIAPADPDLPREGPVVGRARVAVPAGERATATLDAPAPPYIVQVAISPTLVPAELGFGDDPRELGAITDYGIEPRAPGLAGSAP